MKKVITFIIMFIFIFSALSVVAFAEGEARNSKDMVKVILDRVLEWWEANKAEILAALSGLGAVVCSIASWVKSKRPFLSLISSAKVTHERELELIKGYNEVVEVIKGYNEKVEALTGEVAKLGKLVADTEDIESHITKILSTVYTHNDALPQGVKELIRLECVDAMKIAKADLGEKVVIPSDEKDEGKSA